MVPEQISNVLLVIGIVVSLLLMLFFAGMKSAFVSSNRLNVELRRNQGTSEGVLMGKFVDHKHLFISTSYFGIVLCTVMYAFFFNQLLTSGLWLPIQFDNIYLTLLVNVFLSSFLIIFFGKFLAKVIFNRNDKLLYALLFTFNGFHKIFNPIINMTQNFANGILKYLFNVKINQEKHAFGSTNAEQRYYASSDEQEEEEMNHLEVNTHLFENALYLPSLKIRQSLTPRTEVAGLEIKTDINTALRKIIESKQSRMVVYEDNIDNILGYVMMMDFFKNPPDLQSILMPVFIVPETKSVTDLLHRFSKERKSVAWVVDEFGGTAGIITVDNIIRELFGEAQDEFGRNNYVEKRISENEFIFSGRIELARLNEKYDFDFPEKESETLSGYIIRENKRIPKEKERVIVDNYVFDIISVSETKIGLVKVKMLR